jgi:nucleotide-binding universal stress UspA family protein
MIIKDILVYVDEDEACVKRVRSAASLCKVFDAHLYGIYVWQKVTLPGYAAAYIPDNIVEETNKECERIRDQIKMVFLDKSTTSGITREFHAVEGDVSGVLNTRSRYADLLVVPQPLTAANDLNRHFHISDLLIGAACPVLLLPNGNPLSLPLERVLVAWDGGRECAIALNAALPMLSGVNKLDLVSVTSDIVEAADIALHISRHGIETEVHVINESRSHTGILLLEQASKLGSQMMVMGAYGHSRLRELMLGGTTRHMLNHSHLPVFFSH